MNRIESIDTQDILPIRKAENFNLAPQGGDTIEKIATRFAEHYIIQSAINPDGSRYRYSFEFNGFKFIAAPDGSIQSIDAPKIKNTSPRLLTLLRRQRETSRQQPNPFHEVATLISLYIKAWDQAYKKENVERITRLEQRRNEARKVEQLIREQQELASDEDWKKLVGLILDQAK